jgi:hypothetical protein
MSNTLSHPEIVELPAELLETLLQIQDQRQITVVVTVGVNPETHYQRIWPNIEIRSEVNAERAKLIQVIGLQPFPNWTMIPAGVQKQFCLIFETLSSDVSRFSIVEDIPENGGFLETGIVRNKSDVYRIWE